MTYLLLLLPVAWGLVFWWGYRQGTRVVEPTWQEVARAWDPRLQEMARAFGAMGVTAQRAAESFQRFFDAMPKMEDVVRSYARASDGQLDDPKPEADLKP